MSFDRPVQRSTRQFDIAAAVGQTAFTFPAPLFDTADILVLLAVDGAPFVPAVGVTVALTPGLSQGTVTFAVAPRAAAAHPAVVRLVGHRVQSRLSDVTRGGTLLAKSLEDELDRQAIVLQELRRDIDTAVSTAALALATATYQDVAPLAVTVWQFRQALATRGLGRAADAAIEQSRSGPFNAAWSSRGVLAPGDPLLAFVRQALALALTDWAAVLSAAQAFSPETGLSMAAFRTRLAGAGLLDAVAAAVPADLDDATAIDWLAAAAVSSNGRLAALVAAVAGAAAAMAVFGATAAAPASVTMRQFRTALRLADPHGSVITGLSASPDDPARLLFDAATTVAPTDTLGLFAIATLYAGNPAGAALFFNFAALGVP